MIYLYGHGKILNTENLLSMSFLSDSEKQYWISTVDEYANVICDSLRKQSFLDYIRHGNSTGGSEVSHIHTGSIPSQFGKPLMLMSHLPRIITDSFPELCSDHDIMFSIDSLVVHQTKSENGDYLLAEVCPDTGREEFVSLHIMDDYTQGGMKIKNSMATEFLMKVIENTFFTHDGKITDAT